jgi:hypothetical protein
MAKRIMVMPQMGGNALLAMARKWVGLANCCMSLFYEERII